MVTEQQPEPPARTLDQVLERYFSGFECRPGQRQAVEAVTGGRDALVIMPTGGGKSLIYQAAALLLPGCTIVVSPLLALIRDQVQQLRAQGYPGVAALHSHVPAAEQRAALAALREGTLRLLYVTPERCAAASFLAQARQAHISLIAVDEAHALSLWGHDFRPEYQLLDDAARALGRPPMLALTATAPAPVRDEIIERLALRDPELVVTGFDRPNLFYEVYAARDEADKQATLVRLIAERGAAYQDAIATRLSDAAGGRGIVYTSLTATARRTAQALNRAGVHTAYYHGQLKAGQRNAVQARFTDGSVRAIAATNAFGMGIDLADLRYVAHIDPPPSLEAYYQESGRAGRDGGIARCPLIFTPEDLGRAAFSAGSGAVGVADLVALAQALPPSPAVGMTRHQLSERSGLSLSRVIRTLEVLVAVSGARERRGRYRLGNAGAACIERALEREERRQALARTRLEMVRGYVQSKSCRRQFLLQYFGQYAAAGRCGMCDVCVPRGATPCVQAAPPVSRAPVLFRPGDAVTHDTWGAGTIQHITDRRVTVHFAASGYRTLDLRTVLAGRKLVPAS